jgi:hypothetical protein
MRDGRSTAYLTGLQTPAMRGVHPSLNNVATAVVVVGIVVRIVVSVVVPVAIRPVAVVMVPVVVAMKSSNDGTGAKTVEAAIVGSSNDGAGATLKSSSESATVEAAAAKAAHAASVEATATTKAAAAKAAAPVSAATSTATATAATSASTATCLRTRREQRAGKEGGCQYHHRFSSSHESFLSTGGAISDHRTSARPPCGRPAPNS